MIANQTRFLQAIRAERDLSPKTIRAYASDLRDAAARLPHGLDAATTPDLSAYLHGLQQRGLRVATLRRRSVTLRLYYAWLLREGHLAAAPEVRFKPATAGRRRLPRTLTRDEFEALLRAAHAEIRRAATPARRRTATQDALALELLASTGIRVEELTRIDHDDIDLAACSVRIRGKGARERVVPLSSSEVCALLGNALAETGPRGPLLVSRANRRRTPESVRSRIKRLARLAGIGRRVTPHMLRHTFATLLVENGADLRSVQDVLGHASIQTTELYVWVSSRRRADMLEKCNPRNRVAMLG
ncbi:MAG: integrase/recombinase XerD [Thermoplasmata archaeon]|nr:integrase/recombinase XerD [Thermoplasmata archaeon]